MEKTYSDTEIKSMLDLSLSYRENITILKNNGVKIGSDRARQLLNEKKAESGITSYTDEEIKDMINVDLSVRKNLTNLQEKSIKIGKDKLQKLLKEKKSDLANNEPDAQKAIEEDIITTPEDKEKNPFNMTNNFSTAFGSFNNIQEEKKPEIIVENKSDLQRMAEGIKELISATKYNQCEEDPDPDFDVKDEDDIFPFTNDPILKDMYASRKEMKSGQEKAGEENNLSFGQTPTFNVNFPRFGW